MANPREHLLRLIKLHGTQRAAAHALGISGPYLHDLINGRRPFSDRMLAALGLKRTIVLDRKAAR